MNKKFTKLMAALALLVFMMPSLAGWGQTRSVTYEPATSISAGDVVLLVAEATNYKKELSGFTTSGTIYGTVADFTTAPAGVYPLTVVAGNSSGSFAFKNSENKYLSWSSGNSLQLSETLNNSSSWTFNYAYTVTTLTNVGTTSRQIKYNSSSPRFACYTSGQQSIKLYKQVTSSLLDSDLALTGAPIELSFDLYNNASAQTVSFTTSSTGAITVSQSDYITTTVNANNKTITVSPVAVTNGTQTITVSQAATDTYDAGSVTFTVEVTDSTPTTIVTIDDSGITNTDVYVGTAAGSLSATVTSGGSPVSGATVTWSGDNDDVATIASDGTVTLVGVGTVTFTATYAGVSGQYVGSSATYEMTVTSSEPYEQPTTIEIIPNYTFWGKTGQFSGSTYDELDGSQDNVSLHWTRGNGSTYANLSAMRFYKDNDLTFTAPEGYEIISIELSVTGTYNDLTFDPTGFDNETTTWTGAAETVTMSRPANASSYATISKFTITLAAINAVATTTTINVPQDFNTDIYQGTTAGTLTATVKDNENNTISGATVTWSSSNTGVATINANGEVTLVAVGTTTITASFAGVVDEYKPSEGTYEFTVTDSNAPGTENNPYTVAQARAAIDAGTGTQSVYATGIVSAIPTEWSTQYNNITFNFVDNAGDTDFLQAYRCVSGTGVDASTVAVGDIVVVHGNLTKYSSTYEFGQGCELVALTHPTTPFVTVTPSTIDAPFAGADGTLAITYENITEIISFDYYFCDANGNELEGDDPDWIYAEINEDNDTYTLDYIIDANDGAARTAYMKVYTFDDNEEEVYDIVTVNQAEYVAPSYADLPFEYNNGKAAIEETDGLFQEGLGSDYGTDNTKLKFDDAGDWLLLQFNERPGTLTFDIKGNGFSNSIFTVQTSVDGETYDDLVLYINLASTETTKEINTLDADVRYIKWIYSQKAFGNVGLGNIKLDAYTVPVPVASINVNPDEVELDAEEHDGTLDLAYESLTITDMTDFDIQFCDANGDELSEQPDWIEVLVAEQDPEIGEGYVVSYYMVENEGTDARTAYFKVYAMDEETNIVYSNLVTITQAAPVVPPTPSNWVLTDLADLTEDDVFVIVGDNVDTYAMPVDGGGQNGAPAAVAVTVVEGTLSAEPAANLQWNISITEDGYTFYPNGETETWLYCTNNNNGVRVGTGDAKHFTLVEGYLTTTETTDQRYIGIYNSQDWRCYTNTTGNIAGQTFSFYKKVVEPATETYELTINGYGSSTTEGWNLIASPVSTTPDQVTNMLTEETTAPYSYDLYRFNQTAGSEWENYHQHSGDFNIVPGTGYLYANKGNVDNTPNTVTLTFTGVPYDGDGEIELVYSTANPDSKMHGWNLIGNPFNSNVTIGERDFYIMNDNHDQIILADADHKIIAPMQGIFVKAENVNETVTFTRQNANANNSTPALTMNLIKNRGNVIDRAIVRFGQGRQLSKFQLFENSTKLYFAQNNEEMAVVRTEAQGEMPVSFRAAENGTYTLTVNPEGVDMNYLHLIDNMTGADVDLLATPSYTFNATTRDYESRFRLVFAANNEDGVSTGSTAFAFYSNGTWVINNTGEATLQVVDVNGRILSSETVNGSVSKAINASAGVYMLRLINGNDVKTQKIVVR